MNITPGITEVMHKTITRTLENKAFEGNLCVDRITYLLEVRVSEVLLDLKEAELCTKISTQTC